MIQRFSPSLTFVLLFLILYSSTSSHFLVFPFLSYTVDLSLADCRNEEMLIFTLASFFPTTLRIWYLKPMSHSTVTLLISSKTHFWTLRVLFYM